MKRTVICEGKTDAILISYFVKRRFGWVRTKSPVIRLPVVRDNEVLYWYYHPEKPDQELAIWGAGGIDQIPVKLGHIINRSRAERTPINRFGRVVLFFDRNDRNKTQCKDLVEKWATEDNELEITGKLQLGQWVDARVELRKSPQEDYELRILPIVLPPDSEGNLEIFLTNSIRDQSEHDEQLVDRARSFIGFIPDEPYLSKTRYRPKACLGAILSVMSPDWVFSTLDHRLTRVQWEKIRSVTAVYEKLSEL
jgi:hypothetical protein